MRRMIPQKLIDFIKSLKSGSADLEIKGLTSKGIANTGSLGNIGDAVISGNLYVQKDTEENGNLEVEGDASVDGDIEVGGIISAAKVKEDGDTELIDLSPYVFTETAKTNTLYAKMLVNHGVLYIVCSGNFVAQDLSTATNRILLDNFIEAIPESLQSKIKREDGSAINESPSAGSSKICSCVGGRFSGSTQANQLYLLNSYTRGQITLQIRPLPSTAEDTSVYVDARFVLTL